MDGWKVQWKNGNQQLELHVFDKWDPFWDIYEFQDLNAMNPQKELCKKLNGPPSVTQSADQYWFMQDFDVETDYEALPVHQQRGVGSVIVSSGTFPQGEFSWEIVKKISS